MRDFLEFCGLVGDGEDRGPVAGPPAFLRDYFAAQALPQAIEHELNMRSTTILPSEFRYDEVARAAYVMADAMLKAREAK